MDFSELSPHQRNYQLCPPRLPDHPGGRPGGRPCGRPGDHPCGRLAFRRAGRLVYHPGDHPSGRRPLGLLMCAVPSHHTPWQPCPCAQPSPHSLFRKSTHVRGGLPTHLPTKKWAKTKKNQFHFGTWNRMMSFFWLEKNSWHFSGHSNGFFFV